MDSGHTMYRCRDFPALEFVNVFICVFVCFKFSVSKKRQSLVAQSVYFASEKLFDGGMEFAPPPLLNTGHDRKWSQNLITSESRWRRGRGETGKRQSRSKANKKNVPVITSNQRTVGEGFVDISESLRSVNIIAPHPSL